jgi:hypothetical protein
MALAVAAALGPVASRPAEASSSVYQHLTGIPTANPRAGIQPDKVAPGYALERIAAGTDPLENPSGVITHFGYLNDFPPQPVESTKTEPDEHTYLVLKHNPGGPTPGYDYGRHFLFQGHELFSGDMAYVTRINLDVSDPAHRITLLTPVDPGSGKTGLNAIDGSTWNPHTQTLLFTQEAGANGGVAEITPDWPPVVRTLHGILGRAGYEGIHPDDDGNLLLMEDVGGTSVNVVASDPASPKRARQPNSFVYRFVPDDPTDLSVGGKLQALQVSIFGHALTFNDPATGASALGDTFSVYQALLHAPGTAWPTTWVTVHDTAVDGFAAFDANALAKVAGATPFKRPENAQFLPGSKFKTFFFDATGDTNADSGNQAELAARGAWGSIFRVDLEEDAAGTISILVLGDKDHSAFDNLAFADKCTLLAAEDRGDTLHKQLNILDSVWAYNVCDPGAPAKRFMALGRDAASAADANLLDLSTPGFQNEGDNEPTGLHVSTGGATVSKLLGASATLSSARWFVTQQHGDNTVYEIVKSRK